MNSVYHLLSLFLNSFFLDLKLEYFCIKNKHNFDQLGFRNKYWMDLLGCNFKRGMKPVGVCIHDPRKKIKETKIFYNLNIYCEKLKLKLLLLIIMNVLFSENIKIIINLNRLVSIEW